MPSTCSTNHSSKDKLAERSQPGEGASARLRPSGTKRALLIGINYSGQYALRGCVRDVRCMAYLLRTKCGFKASNVTVLTDKESHIPGVQKGLPTRANIRSAMKNLVSGAKSGDSLFFHFSGHGSQVIDHEGTEISGYDQVIIPMDYKTAGYIVDDDMHNIMVRRLARGARLMAVLDCCHSGTGLDLAYNYNTSSSIATTSRSNSSHFIRHRDMGSAVGVLSALDSQELVRLNTVSTTHRGQGEPIPKRQSHANTGQVLLFSACRDSQVAADVRNFATNTATGAMTVCFIEAVLRSKASESGPYSYRHIMRFILDKLRRVRCSQTPQFSSSHKFDMSTHFSL